MVNTTYSKTHGKVPNRMRAFHGIARALRPRSKLIIFICVPLLLVYGISMIISEISATSDARLTEMSQKRYPVSTTKILPHVYRHDVNGVEMFSQIPDINSTVNGVVLLFHGCNHDGIDWFELPEEKIIVKHLMSLSLAAISISSQVRTGSRCWSSSLPALNPDFQKVPSALSSLYGHIFPNGRPRRLYAIGVSSGGFFMPILMQAIKFDGVVCQISASEKFKDMKKIPPLAFVYMAKDRHANEETVNELVDVIRKKQPQTKGFQCNEKPVTVQWLYDRIDDLTMPNAEAVLSLLSSRDLLHPETSVLTKNTRRVWSNLTKQEPLSNFSKVLLSSIEEEFNVAYAQHELTSEHIEEVMKFIIGGNRLNALHGFFG